MAKPRLVVLDANALIHRAFHALPPLTSPSGEPVGALYGLCLTLLNVLKTFQPSHVVAAFDRPEKTFRHEQFEAYKAQRKKVPDELVAQIIRARDILEAFAIPVVDAKGYEADDIIGTVTKQAAKKELESVIVTGDQDALQLADDRTRVYLLRRGIKDTVTLGPAEIRERFGLTPDQLIDYKALRGDPSDNIPGVRGVGEKTASKLLQKYETLEGIYQNLEKVPEGVRKKLEHGKNDALLSRKLVTIQRSVPIGMQLEAFERHAYDRPRVITLFQELGFASLLPRLPETSEAGGRGQGAGVPQQLALRTALVKKPKTPGYRLLRTAGEVTKAVAAARKAGSVVVDTETDQLGARTEPLHGVSLAWAESEAVYIPVEHVPLLEELLEDPRVPKFGHNLKYDIEVLTQAGIRVHPLVFDTRLASYILAPGTRAHDLDTLSFTILGHEKISIETLIGKGKNQRRLSSAPLEDVTEYSCEDADMTLRLVRHFEKELAEKPRLRIVFDELEMPLIPVLAHLELTGVKLDVRVLARQRATARRQLASLERRIHRLVGAEFNIASPQQLQAALFERLRLPSVSIARTQTGLSTAAEELDKLQEAHPVVPLIQEYRELAKLVGTYLEALPKLVDAKTGRVYTTYNQTTTATGRLSSSDPNLQNIPIRTELGAAIRKAFIAEKGYTLVAADYSQLQLRLAAHIAKDKAMQEAFKDGRDIHTETAAVVFGIPAAKVTSTQRRVAKTLNFGVLYGMGPQSFARAAGIPLAEAQQFIDAYFRTYRGIAEYMQEAKAAAVVQGYVETIAGRRRYLPEITSRNPQIRGEAERMAINHPIQGGEADMIKRAMIRLFAEIEAGRGAFANARMILQVHDELVFEVPQNQASAVAKEIQAIMEGVERLSVPVIVDIQAGKTWGALKELV